MPAGRPRGGNGGFRGHPAPMSERQQLALLLQMTSQEKESGKREGQGNKDRVIDARVNQCSCFARSSSPSIILILISAAWFLNYSCMRVDQSRPRDSTANLLSHGSLYDALIEGASRFYSRVSLSGFSISSHSRFPRVYTLPGKM